MKPENCPKHDWRNVGLLPDGGKKQRCHICKGERTKP